MAKRAARNAFDLKNFRTVRATGAEATITEAGDVQLRNIRIEVENAEGERGVLVRESLTLSGISFEWAETKEPATAAEVESALDEMAEGSESRPVLTEDAYERSN